MTRIALLHIRSTDARTNFLKTWYKTSNNQHLSHACICEWLNRLSELTWHSPTLSNADAHNAHPTKGSAMSNDSTRQLWPCILDAHRLSCYSLSEHINKCHSKSFTHKPCCLSTSTKIKQLAPTHAGCNQTIKNKEVNARAHFPKKWPLRSNWMPLCLNWNYCFK